MYSASANVSSPGYLSSRGWSAEALVAAMAYASVWIWYLNRYRLKGGSTPLPPSTLKPSVAESVEETQAHDAAKASGADQDSSIPPSSPSPVKPYQAKSVEETPANDAAVAMNAEEAHPDIYAEELELFEAGELDQSLWAKHIVETEGDSEKAKWRYIKERVATAPSRKAEQEKIRAEKEAALAEQERIRAEREAARVAEQEAAEKAKRDELIRVKAEAARRKRGEELARGNRQFIGLIVVVTALVLFVVF